MDFTEVFSGPDNYTHGDGRFVWVFGRVFDDAGDSTEELGGVFSEMFVTNEV